MARDDLRPGVGVAPATATVRHLCAELDVIARRLGGLSSSAMDQGDFDRVARLVDASQAVHRALVALDSDGWVTETTVTETARSPRD